MVVSNKFASDLSVSFSLKDQFSGGKEKRVYCKKGEAFFVTVDNGNVQIAFGKNGYFPILTSSIEKIMISSPEELINKIKEVDSKMSYGFPIAFVTGIISNKPWKEEFIEKLKKSDVRPVLKTDILKEYEGNRIIQADV